MRARRYHIHQRIVGPRNNKTIHTPQATNQTNTEKPPTERKDPTKVPLHLITTKVDNHQSINNMKRLKRSEFILAVIINVQRTKWVSQKKLLQALAAKGLWIIMTRLPIICRV